MIFHMRRMFPLSVTLAAALAGFTMTPSTAIAEDKATDVEWVAHRGESADAPENTLAAINLAWDRGNDAAEFDIHLTKDGKMIAIHDFDTFRVTGGEENGGTKLIVKDETVESLQKLDVGSWKSPTYAGEKMPLLEDVLATIPKDKDKRFFIEIKVGPECADSFVETIRKVNLPMEQTAMISFKLDTCREIKKRLPEMKVYYLADFKPDKQTGKVVTVEELIQRAKDSNLDGLDLSFKGPIDAAFVKKVKDAGLEMYVWTVDDPEIAKRMIEAGVDGITSNKPAWLKKQVTGTATAASR